MEDDQSIPEQRLQTLDILRGVAVMGILLMNIISFSMPEPAYFNPRAWGGMSFADQTAWFISFVFVDAKMRSLFSILFGASMLLFIEKAEDRGDNPGKLHFRRMGWLALFGYLHYLFIWEGDILFLYAAMGIFAWFWRKLDAKPLLALSAIMFGLAFLMWASFATGLYQADAKASAPDASSKDIRLAQSVRGDFGEPGSKVVRKQLHLLRSSYGAIFKNRAIENPTDPIRLVTLFGLETLGLMALGMALLRNGFLAGSLSLAAYRKTALWTLGISLPALTLLALWCQASGYEVLRTATATLLLSLPFRAPLATGYAALIILAFKRWSGNRLFTRLSAAGQAAFTNYLGTSLLMTLIFYGYGFGLYGHISRAPVYGFVLFTWAIMLFWSKPWMERYRHGPLEWVWRCLTRFERVPLRR